MEEIAIFNNPDFGDIRILMIENEPWFVGVDIAKALGYKKPTGAVTNNVDKDDTLTEGVMDSMGRKQNTLIVNESGLYSLIFNSKLESARTFKKWVTSEVLPCIRKTGEYKIKNTGDVQFEGRPGALDFHGTPVITTSEIAKHYRVSSQNVLTAFYRNKEYFKQGVHYFILEADEACVHVFIFAIIKGLLMMIHFIIEGFLLFIFRKVFTLFQELSI